MNTIETEVSVTESKAVPKEPTAAEENAENVKVLHSKLAVRSTNQLLYLAKLLKAIPEIVDELGPAGEVEVYLDTLERQKGEKEAELNALQSEIGKIEELRQAKLGAAEAEARELVRAATQSVEEEKARLARSQAALEAEQQTLTGQKGSLTIERDTIRAQVDEARREYTKLVAERDALAAANKEAQLRLDSINAEIERAISRIAGAARKEDA